MIRTGDGVCIPVYSLAFSHAETEHAEKEEIAARGQSERTRQW